MKISEQRQVREFARVYISIATRGGFIGSSRRKTPPTVAALRRHVAAFFIPHLRLRAPTLHTFVSGPATFDSLMKKIFRPTHALIFLFLALYTFSQRRQNKIAAACGGPREPCVYTHTRERRRCRRHGCARVSAAAAAAHSGRDCRGARSPTSGRVRESERGRVRTRRAKVAPAPCCMRPRGAEKGGERGWERRWVICHLRDFNERCARGVRRRIVHG